MKLTRIPVELALLSAFALLSVSAPVAAQKPSSRPTGESDKHGIEMDELSRTMLDNWEKVEYHLGRAGVKTLSFKVNVVTESPLGDAKATGTYAWDGKKGKLTWDDATLGAMLATRGWSAESFDRLVIGDSHRRELKGVKLTAKKKGDTTIVSVKGETKQGLKNFHYDKDGVGRQFTMTIDDPALGKTEATIALTFEKDGGKYVHNGWSFAMDLPMGAYKAVVKIKNKKVGKFWVYGTVEERMTMKVEGVDEPQDFGTQTLTFTDYKINGTIKEAPRKADPKATSQGGAKPGKEPAKGAVKATSRPKGPPKK